MPLDDDSAIKSYPWRADISMKKSYGITKDISVERSISAKCKR